MNPHRHLQPRLKIPSKTLRKATGLTDRIKTARRRMVRHRLGNTRPYLPFR